jgi:hypothetical protein
VKPNETIPIGALVLMTKSQGVHDFMNHDAGTITTDEDRLFAALHSEEAVPALSAARGWKEAEVIALRSRRHEPYA